MTHAPASPVLEAALRWIERGAAPIPVKYREKVPVGVDWQKQRLNDADARAAFNGTPLNLGILWGEPSGHIVDIDLDWPEACGIAAAILPPTAVYGRESSRSSHRLYRVQGAVTSKWSVQPELVPAGHKSMVLELRADGTQSVVPPSTHPSGEQYLWARERRPQEIDYQTLLRKLNLVAAGSLLVGHWRDGVRHDLALALSGAALSSGYTVDEVSTLVTAIAEAAGDPEVRDRGLAARSSADALAAGKPATGLPKLAALVGESTVAALKRWLGLGSFVPQTTTTATLASHVPWSGAEAALTVRSVDTIQEVPMKWLWPNRIARGKLHVLAGEPGLSKSVLTCTIAAIVTTGGDWPLDGTRSERGDVLMLNVEDDPADTIRPRLRAAGADLSRVVLIDGVRIGEGKVRGMTLADVELLEAYLVQKPGRFSLLICDPVGALMANRDTHRDSDVRSLLAPLATLAMRHDLAIVLVAHLNKATGMAALHRIVGSIGFTAAARMVYFLARDPDEPNRLLLVPGKANIAPAGMAGISYELESADLGNGVVAPRIKWHDVPEMRSANEVLAPAKPEKVDEAQQEQSEIEGWLCERLAGGPVLVRTLQEDAKLKIPASWRTVERAAGRMGVVGIGEHRSRMWELPEAAGGIPTFRHPATNRLPLSECHAAGQDDTTLAQHDMNPDSCRDVEMTECRNAATASNQPTASRANGSVFPDEQAVKLSPVNCEAVPKLSPIDMVGFLAAPIGPQPALPLLPTEIADLRPCGECTRLNVGDFCAHYRRVMPEPGTPNACAHFEQRQPDVPW